MHITLLTDLNIANKSLLVRVDLNAPMQGTTIANDQRLQAVLPSIRYMLQQHAKIILMSHLGRPKVGEFDAATSLAPIAQRLQQLLQHEVRLVQDWQDGVAFNDNEIILLENIRCYAGENENDDVFAKQLANLCDIYVMDAFATAHRAQASTHGVAKFAKQVCAGPLLCQELTALQQAFTDPKRPLLAIVGGAKVSTKLAVLKSLLHKVDRLIIGGGIANTFLAAQGYAVGKSLYEPDLLDTANEILQLAETNNVELPLPIDVVVATEINNNATTRIKSITEIASDEMILDIGPQTQQLYQTLFNNVGTIIWNGPVGVFEYQPFAEGTQVIAETVANSPAFSLAGGGDTINAIEQFHITDKISYISTGGGAFLEFIEGQTLPAVAMLQQRNS